MDANDHQISEGADAVGVAAREGESADVSGPDDRIAESLTAESPIGRDDATPTFPREAERSVLERELRLLKFVPIRDDPENRPSFDRPSSDSPAKRFRPDRATIGVVAGLGCLVCMAAVVGYDRVQYSHLLAAKIHDNQNLASAINGLKGRLDAVEAARDKDEATELRRVLAEIKTSAAATRDFGTALAQLSSRVDHIEKDQSARFDKLGERIDHEASARVADLTARLDKLEKKPATTVVVSAAPPPTAPPKTTPSQVVSTETTGSIEKPKPRLRGFTVADVRDGYAVVDSRDGPQPVVAGDFIPGAGRVLRIERRGQNWTVVTTQGIITEDVTP